MDPLYCIRHWRRWIGFLVIIAYLVVLVIALPLCVWELEKQDAADHVEAWFIGGIFVMMALPISCWGILQHVINYTVPVLQRHIIRILWMVPIYAVNAWFALRFPAAAIYLDTLRECYEAYVIYNFMAYLLSFLRTEYPHLEVQMESKPPVKHLFPLCCLPPCQNGRKFIQRCKHGVLQYTVVRPAMTVIALLCEMFGKYGEGDFNFQTAWSYIVLINNVSQILAMYCLVLFYKAFKEELQPLKPLPKFLCVKAVVFLSFWQALVIAVLVKLNVIPQEEVSKGIQDFLICIEMFLAAIAHYFSFSHKPFINLAAEHQNCFQSFLSMWNVSDVTEDVVEHARYIGHGVHKRLNRNRTGQGERTPLLVDSSRERFGSQMAQNRGTPSPAVVLEKEEAKPFDFDYSSVEQSDFADRSTTLSMNNYAAFSEMSVSVERSASPRSLSDSQGASVGSMPLPANPSFTQQRAVQEGRQAVEDEHFEEIQADELNQNDFPDSNLGPDESQDQPGRINENGNYEKETVSDTTAKDNDYKGLRGRDDRFDEDPVV